MKIPILPIFLSLIFFTFGLATLKDYGLNWDSPFRYLRGQAYLSLLIPQSNLSPVIIAPEQYASRFDASAYEGPQPSSGQISSDYWNLKYYVETDSGGHHPLIDIIAAISHSLFHNFLGQINSFHLPIIIISSIGVFLASVFTYQLTKSHSASFISAISLGLFPFFFSESHFNLKDPTQAVFFLGTIWSFWNWFYSKKLRWFIGVCIFSTLALGIKWNIAFLPIIILGWLISQRNSDIFKHWFNLKKISIYFICFFIFSFCFLLATWPSAWFHPLKNFSDLVKFYVSTGTQSTPLQPPGFIHLGFNFYPLSLLLTQTPEIILLLTLIGIFFLFKKNHPDKYLFLLWLVVPIARFSLPHTWFYLGYRQFMEIIPGFAILSGLGFHFVSQKISPRTSALLGFGICSLLLVPIIHLHPNENIYFNHLAFNRQGLLDPKATYGNIYKQAADWLNTNAHQNSQVGFTDGPEFALSPWLLRDDISISPNYFSGLAQKGEYLLIRPNSSPDPVFAYNYPTNSLNPLHTISVNNIPLLYIYKNSPEVSRYDFSQIKKLSTSQLPAIFPQPLQVTGITLQFTNPQCQTKTSLFTDEFIQFDGVKYGQLERQLLPDSTLLISFPPTLTKSIQIINPDLYSCFIGAKINYITYLP